MMTRPGPAEDNNVKRNTADGQAQTGSRRGRFPQFNLLHYPAELAMPGRAFVWDKAKTAWATSAAIIAASAA